MTKLEQIRKEIEDMFQSKGYKIVGAQEKESDIILYLKIPKEAIKE